MKRYHDIVGRLSVAFLLFLTAPASALPLVESSDHSVHLDGSMKSFVFGLHFPHFDKDALQLTGLVDGRWGAIGAADLRIKLEGEHAAVFKWQFHVRTQPYLSSFSQAQGSLGFVSAAQPARLLPLEVTGPNQGTFEWRHEVDRLNLQLRLGKVDIVLGRQPISFGVGFVWLPADLVGTFSPIEIDQEFKPGLDALRINVALGEFSELTLVGAMAGPRCLRRADTGDYRLPNGQSCSQGRFRVTEHHSLGVVRLRTTVADWDIGLLTGWVRGDLVAGAFTVGTIKRFRVRSETVYTADLEWDAQHAGSGNPNNDARHFVRAVVGTDYTFDTERLLSLFAEFYFNGFGSMDADDYLERARRPRVSEFGEVFNVGKLYFATGVNWELHEKLPLSLVVLANLHDPSFFVSATASYQAGDEAVFVLGVQAPIGAGPEIDIGSQRPIRARSEFGLNPFIYFTQWKVYF